MKERKEFSREFKLEAIRQVVGGMGDKLDLMAGHVTLCPC